MRGKDRFELPIDSVVIEIKGVESIELTDVTIEGPSFSEFYLTQGLTAYNVNVLMPFTVFGYSVNLMMYVIAVLSGLIITGNFIIRKKKRDALEIVVVVFLALYFGLDAREDYEELVIMKTHNEEYLSAMPTEKIFHYWDNLVEFSDFIRNAVSSEKHEVYFIGNDDRYAYMKYLLYPMKIEHREDVVGNVHIFSAFSNMHLVGNNLYLNDRMVLTGGKGFTFGWRSFLYLDPAR
jgi:hypothetical protein